MVHIVNFVNFFSILFVTLQSITVFLYSGAFSVLLFNIIFFVILFFLYDNKYKYHLILLYVISSLFACAVHWYWLNFYGSCYYLGAFSDDFLFDNLWSLTAFDMKLTNVYDLKSYFNLHNSVGYVYILMILRFFGEFFGGYNTLLPRFLNCFVLVNVSYFCLKIFKMYSKTIRFDIFLLYFIALFPVLLFNSVHVFRDTIVVLISYIFYYNILVKKKYSIFLNVILIFIIYFFRSANAVLLAIFLPLFYFENLYKIRKFFLVFVVIMIFIMFFSWEYIEKILSQTEAYHSLNIERTGNIGSRIFSIPIYIGIIPRMIFLIFTPVPKITPLFQFYISISTFLQILLFPFFLKFISFYKKLFALKIIFIVNFLGVALTTATFRHTMLYLPFYIVFSFIVIDSDGFRIDDFYIKRLLLLLFFFSATLIGVLFV